MPTTSTVPTPLTVTRLRHPQGCCTYLVADPASREALVLDAHLDLVDDVAERVRREGLKLSFIVDSHTHADHPSGAAALAEKLDAKRVAHPAGEHSGVDVMPADGDTLPLGELRVTVRHAPGHTPDHMVLVTERELFAGDSLFIGGVARTDFLGGDAGTLHDTLQRILADLDDDVVLWPGHDYDEKERSTIGAERASNPWLAMERAAFVEALTANPPPRPANMDDLLMLNRGGVEIPRAISGARAAELVAAGGGASVIDVRAGVEYDGEHVPGSLLVPLDKLGERLDIVRATPAPRLVLCRTGTRSEMARELLAKKHVRGVAVIEGGLLAYLAAGGRVERGRERMSLDRQVRVVAGTMIVVASGLAFWAHPAWLLLTAFVGSGLVFAGATDWCGMGLVLARAPWNKSAAEASAAVAGACAANQASACAALAPPSEG